MSNGRIYQDTVINKGTTRSSLSRSRSHRRHLTGQIIKGAALLTNPLAFHRSSCLLALSRLLPGHNAPLKVGSSRIQSRLASCACLKLDLATFSQQPSSKASPTLGISVPLVGYLLALLWDLALSDPPTPLSFPSRPSGLLILNVSSGLDQSPPSPHDDVRLRSPHGPLLGPADQDGEYDTGYGDDGAGEAEDDADG